jgi:hypothetical protein
LKKNKKKIFLSLILFNIKYINIFFKYTLKSIINSINYLNNNNNNYDFILFITTSEKDSVLIKKNFSEINKLNFKISYEIKDENNFINKYKTLTQFQLDHFQLAKNKKYDFFLFLYADLIISKNSLFNSLNLLKYKNKSVILTFALELLVKKKFKEFFLFFIKNNLKKVFASIYDNKLITTFHRSFELNNYAPRKSFYYFFNKDFLLLKTLHYHPFIFNLRKIKNTIIDVNKFESIDNGFLSYLNIKYNNIFVENNFSKLLLFSVTFKSRIKSLNSFNKIFKKIKFLELFSFFYSIKKSSSIEKKLFINKTFFFNNKNKNFISSQFNSFSKNISNFEKDLDKNSKILYFNIFEYFRNRTFFILHFIFFSTLLLHILFFPILLKMRPNISFLDKYFSKSKFYKTIIKNFFVLNFYLVRTIFMSLKVSNLKFLIYK